MIDKSKEMGINISGFLEVKLIEHIYKKYSLEKQITRLEIVISN